ncbi:MAG: hypothetical protein ACYC5N_01755 [Endomicrobiales bacterium]
MDEKEIISSPDVYLHLANQELPLPGNMPAVDTPEKITQDLLKTEKEIASSMLVAFRARHAKEKSQWEMIYSEKQQESLLLRTRLAEAEERLKQLRGQWEEERQTRLEEIRLSAQGVENKKQAEKKKWEFIADEVRGFREAAVAAQGRLAEEQGKTEKLKKTSAEIEKEWKEKVYARDEDILKLRERQALREENWLKTLARKDEEIHLLQDQLGNVQQSLNDERQYQGKVVEKKDTDLEGLQRSLQDTVMQLSLERQKLDENAARITELQKTIQALEDEARKKAMEYEQERSQLLKTFREEQSGWEKYKQEYIVREETLQGETEEQIRRILKSVSIIEQQHSDEQKLRKEAEEKLTQKDQEIQGLLSQKEGLIQEWKKILSAERETWQKQQEEILSEFERIKKFREDEFSGLRKEMSVLHSALAEESRLYAMEKEGARQMSAKLQQMEADGRKLAGLIEAREKEWQATLMADQELFRKQMDETKMKYETQLQSRDLEIYRLDEDLNMLNGQVLELRQKLSLEKNENNSRLDRVQELETETRNITTKYNQERAEWHKRLQFVQNEWEKKYEGALQYQTELEGKYRADVKSCQDTIKGLRAEYDASREERNHEKNRTAPVETPGKTSD